MKIDITSWSAATEREVSLSDRKSLPDDGFFSGELAKRDRKTAQIIERYFRGPLTGLDVDFRPPETRTPKVPRG